MSRLDSGRVLPGNQPRHPRLFAACLLTGLSIATVAFAAPSYSVTSLSRGTTPLYPVGISNAGHIAGNYSVEGPMAIMHAFVRTPNGTVTEIPTLAGGGALDADVYALAQGVNSSGEVVGLSQSEFQGPFYAFLYRNGQTINLSPYLQNSVGQAFAISDNGLIVGTYETTDSTHAFVLRPDEVSGYTLTDLGRGLAYGVSESGYVVGESLDANGHSRPFVFRDANQNDVVDAGEFSLLGTLGGTSQNIARDVNDSGTVVGQSQDANQVAHAVRWNSTAPGTLPTDLGNFGVYDAVAHSINNAGQIVGAASLYAFLYEGNQLKQLSRFIPTLPQTSVASWQLYFATGINNAGEIVGEGHRHDAADQTGFLLKASGSQPPTSEVTLTSFAARPGTITLGSKPVAVTFTLGLSGKTKSALSVPLVLSLDGTPVAGVSVNIGKNKSAASATVSFNRDWTPGTYTVTASYGGVEKTATLVVNPAPPITLKSFKFPKKVKRGKKVSASVTLSEAPTGTAEIKLALLDAAQNPLGLEYTLTLSRKSKVSAKITIPAEVPAGTYHVSASYGGITQVVQFQVL